MSGPRTGHKCKLYINTGSEETPVWLLIDEIQDASISDFSLILAELKRRANKFTKNLAALFNSITVDFQYVHGLGATVFDTLRTMFLNMTPAEFAFMDGPIGTSGSEGLRLPCLLSNFPWDQALESASTHDCQLAIAYMEASSDNSEIDPSWLVVS